MNLIQRIKKWLFDIKQKNILSGIDYDFYDLLIYKNDLEVIKSE